MAISADDILALAERLAASAQSEAETRNVMGRGYYAAYHYALALLDVLGAPPPSSVGGPGGTHTKTFDLLVQNANKVKVARDKGRAVAYVMKGLHRQRCEADYEIQANLPDGAAREMLRNARRVRDELSAVRSVLASTAA